MSAPIACDLSVFTDDEREQHFAVSQALFKSAREVKALPDGYAFHIPVESLVTAAEFIQGERRCCPFWTFGIEVQPEGGAIWFSLTAEGAKELLRSEIAPLLNPQVAVALT